MELFVQLPFRDADCVPLKDLLSLNALVLVLVADTVLVSVAVELQRATVSVMVKLVVATCVFVEGTVNVSVRSEL